MSSRENSKMKGKIEANIHYSRVQHLLPYSILMSDRCCFSLFIFRLTLLCFLFVISARRVCSFLWVPLCFIHVNSHCGSSPCCGFYASTTNSGSIISDWLQSALTNTKLEFFLYNSSSYIDKKKTEFYAKT